MRDDFIGTIQLTPASQATEFDVPSIHQVSNMPPACSPLSAKELGRTRNRPAREQALIAAGTRLFATKGYEATTTREIAAEAGCAEGLIHRYFQGKEGLLFAIIRSRNSGLVETTTAASPAASLGQEVLQLVESEIDRMWQESEFFRVVMPRAFLDPNLGHVLNRVGPQRRASRVRERLRAACHGKPVSDHDIEALTNFIGTIGFMFGFVRPVVLGEDCVRSRAVAIATAEMLVRSL